MQDFDSQNGSDSDEGRVRELAALQEQAPIVEALESGNRQRASQLGEAAYGTLLGRYCMALLGELGQAQTLSTEIIQKACEQWMVSKPELPTFRSYLLMQAKKRCAVELSASKVVPVPNASGATRSASEARRLLSELRPSERELLVLRYVGGLSDHEISGVFAWDEGEALRRLSGAIVEACYATDPRIVPSFVSEERKAFLEQLAKLIDGSASTSLRLRVAEDDALRDELHVATQVTRRIAGAADDYTPQTGTHVVATASMTTTQVIPETAAPMLTTQVISEAGTNPAKAVAPNPTDGSVAPSDVGTSVSADRAGKEQAVRGTVVAEVSPLPKKQAWIVAGVVTVVVAAIAVAVVGVGRWLPNNDAKGAPLTLTLNEVKPLGQAGRVELCAGRNKSCRAAVAGTVLAPGDVLRTSGEAKARFDLKGLGQIVVERNTEVALDDAQRTLELERGSLSVELAGKDETQLGIRTKAGLAEVSRASATVFAEPERALLEVRRGSVAITNLEGQRATVHAGEEGVLEGKAAPAVYARSGQSVGLAVDEGLDDTNQKEALSRGLGELIAKKPGETKERADAVHLSRHHVSVRIVGAVARTEIEEVFANDTNDVLEGVFRFPLPPDAQVERLALDVDGRLVEGAFVDRERAAAIWRGNIVNAAPQMKQQIKDDIVWVPGPWRDPALLEWQRGNRFELRIYPIPKQGQRRIVLAYTQVLPEAFGRRQYSYPLPTRGRSEGPVEDFSVDLELRNHDPAVKPKVRGYEVEQSRDGTDVTRLRLLAQRFVPKGDFGVEFALPNRDQSLQAWAYRSDDVSERPYAAMLLRPKLPTSQSSETRDFAFVLDVSRSMYGENLRRAAEIVSRMLSEIAPEDRVTLLACDSDCRAWPPGLIPVDSNVTARAEQWLTQLTAEGASDPGFAIESAMRAIGSSPARRIELVYVGDGTATVGAVRPAALQNYVRRIVEGRQVQVTAVAIGTDSDLPSLRALARGGRGTVVPYVPGTSVSRASRVALASILGNHLSDVSIELPEGMALEGRPEQVLAAGGELLVAARLNGSRARGDVVVRGRIAEQPFEQRYPIDLTALSGERHAFVPRLYAAARIAELDALGDVAAKREAVELSRRFSVASRYTSLLVLESSAMFKAFGLDNQRQAQTWTGELESEATYAEADSETKAESSEESAVSSPKEAAVATAMPTKAPMSVARGAAGSGGSRKASSALGMAAPASPAAAEAMADRPLRMDRDEAPFDSRRMVPMRRIWERQGEVLPGVRVATKATKERIATVEAEFARFSDRRNNTKLLFDLYVAGGEPLKAESLAERWNERDPLDVEAIVGRADMAASRGQRDLAIRILGSVIDVRPGDVGAQQRLLRLHRWQGQDKTACRFAVALAAFRPKDESSIAEALRCTQTLGHSESQFAELGRELMQGLEPNVVQAASRLATTERKADKLSGDLQLFAKWQGSSEVDLDLALIDPDGHRISWLGAPSRSVISALDVVSKREESLGLRGAKPGQYVIEITRAQAGTRERGPVSGTLEVVVAGHHQTIAFTLTNESDRLGLVTIKQVARLVPLSSVDVW